MQEQQEGLNRQVSDDTQYSQAGNCSVGITVPYTLGAYKSLSECVSAVKAELHKKAVNPDDHGACIMWVSDSQRREG